MGLFLLVVQTVVQTGLEHVFLCAHKWIGAYDLQVTEPTAFWEPSFDDLGEWWDSLPSDLKSDLLALGNGEPSPELVERVRQSNGEIGWARWVDAPSSTVEYLPLLLTEFLANKR